MNNKLTDLKKCDKCMGIGIFECEHNTSTKINMPDIKQRARKLFDERFPIVNIGRDIKFNEINGKKEIKTFIDEIIDIAVSERDKEVIDKVSKYSSYFKREVSEWGDSYTDTVKGITEEDLIQLLSRGKLSAEALNIK